MSQNVKTPAGRARALEEMSAVGTADTLSIASHHRFYQAKKLAARLGLSLAHASVVAEQAYAVPETWGSRA